MLLGLDQAPSFLRRRLKGKKIGILCHAASVNSKLVHILDLFPPHPYPSPSRERVAEGRVRGGGYVASLFGPEHGLWGVAQDMELVGASKDSHTGLSVYSLYGSTLESLKPKKEWLEGLDAVVCDLQDIGVRYYTFAYSVIFMMEACKELGIPVYLLDRPNPLNGLEVEGAPVQVGFESFVGRYPLPNRHGMTLGELALCINEEFGVRSSLVVIPLKGWRRRWYFDEAKLSWVMPSPNMPSLSTAMVYPGLCLLEATEISEGRGTTRPFEIFGAPFIDPFQLALRLKDFKLAGVYFRPLYFKPTFHKFAEQVCGGLQLHVTDRKRFRPYLTGLAILKAIYDLYPQDFRWREKAYEFVNEIPAIDLLTGSNRFRNDLEKGTPWKEIRHHHEEGQRDFLKMRKNYLLYR